jgi:hypothetical protein
MSGAMVGSCFAWADFKSQGQTAVAGTGAASGEFFELDGTAGEGGVNVLGWTFGRKWKFGV